MELKDTARDLDKDGIRIITLAVGPESNPGELEKVTPTKKDLMTIDMTGIIPEKLAELIVRKIQTGTEIQYKNIIPCKLFLGYILRCQIFA